MPVRSPRRRRQESEVKGHDERNFASLLLIPSTRRLDTGVLTQERKVTLPGGKLVTITCRGTPDYGLPRGSDNDVLVILLNLFIEAGCPEDRTVVITAGGLLGHLGWPKGGTQYETLLGALNRLNSANYSVMGGWYEAARQRYSTISFAIISTFERVTEGPEGASGAGQLGGTSVLRITLHEQVAKSVRDGYIKPLNLELYAALATDAARALYRFLDVELEALRLRGTRSEPSYVTSLEHIAANLGLNVERSDHLRRTVKQTLDELVTHGYLESAVITGRGGKARVCCVFRSQSPIDPEVRALLIEHGVGPSRADSFARDLDLSTTERLIKAAKAAGTKREQRNPGAYLATLLANEVERQRNPAPASAPPAKAASGRTAPMQALLQAPDPLAGSLDQAISTIFSPFTLRNLTALGLNTEQIDRLIGLLRTEAAPRETVSARVALAVGTRNISPLTELLPDL